MISSLKDNAPKHTAQNLYVYLDGPQEPISYNSSFLWMHDLVPKGQCLKPLCVLKRVPKAYIWYVSSYLIYIICLICNLNICLYLNICISVIIILHA